MGSIVANPMGAPSTLRDIIRPQFHQNNFAEEAFVKNELGLKLDKGVCYCHAESISSDLICLQTTKYADSTSQQRAALSDLSTVP